MKLINTIDQNISLMTKMIQQTGSAINTMPTDELEVGFRRAVFRCLFCKTRAQCRPWLAEGHENAKAPSFCPNADFMNSKGE